MSRSLMLIVLMMIVGSALNAQNTSDTVKYELPAITVTATRVSESSIAAPLAISILGGKDLRGFKGYGLDEALSSVPGVLAQSRYGNQDVRLSIRGFGARGAGARSNVASTRGIRILVDGFPETEPDGRTSLDLIDLSGAEQIEIVRSNASAVWGNAAGGVVNVFSPVHFERPYASVQSMFGSFGLNKQNILSGSELGKGRLFLSLSITKADGWRNHSGSSQTLLNTGIVSPIGESTSLGVYLSGTTNLFRIPGPLSQAQFDSLPQQADSSFIRRDDRRYNRLGRLGVSVDHQFDSANSVTVSTFVSPKYLQRSERNRFRDFNRYHVGGNAIYKNSSAPGASSTNIFLAGVDEAYQDGAILFYDLTPTGDRGTTIIADKREGANNLGMFVQDEFSLDERINITAGVRYDDIAYYYDDYVRPTLNDVKHFVHATPKLGISYRFAPNHSIYANLGGGVEVPAGNEVDPAPTFGVDTVRAINPLLDPITSRTVEIGTKHYLTFGDEGNRALLTYDLAAYLVDVSNDIVAYSGGAFYFTAGKTRRIGLEVSGQLRLPNGVSLTTALTFSSNTYIDYLIDSVHYGVPGASANLHDKKMSGVPQGFYHLDVRYAPPAMSGFYVRASMNSVGSYFADDRNLYEVPSYTLFDLSAGVDELAIGKDGLFVSGFLTVDNVADQHFAASVWINPDLVGGVPVYLEPGLPRNVVGSLGLGWKF